MDIIKSKDNPKVKRYALLHDRRKASKESLVFIEGVRLCEDALLSGIRPMSVAFSENRADLLSSWEKEYDLQCEKLIMTQECFGKICSTVNPQGVAMLVRMPDLNGDIPVRGHGKDLYVVLEDLQDPGNLGTIIRMADAFDMTAVIMTGNTADPFNEKVLRASMGSVWHIPLITVKDASDALTFFSRNGIMTVATALDGAPLEKAPLHLPAAFFVGNEGAGMKAETIASCDVKVRIRMDGKAESLNAASAASITGYILASLR